MKKSHSTLSIVGQLLVLIGFLAVPVWATDEVVTGNLSVAGTSALTGNVGIGTTSPAASLDVNGSLLVTAGAAGAGTYSVKAVGAVGSGTNRDIFLAGAAGLSNGFTVQRVNDAMRYVFNDGGVGIGTATPAALLHLQSAGGTMVRLQKTTATAAAYDLGIEGTGNFLFDNAGIARLMTITPAGNVGFGTASPGASTNATGPMVDTTGAFISTRGLNQNLPRFIFYDDKYNASYVSYDSDAITRFKSTNNWYWQSVGVGANIYTGGTTLMALKSNGNLGIGTTNPGASTNATGPLVETTGAFISTRGLNQNLPRFIFYDDQFNASYVSYDSDAITRFKSTNSWYWQSVGIGANIYTGGTTLMTLNSSGSLGLGTTNPGTYKLAVVGKIHATEVVVETGWSDYVFADDYRLAPLSEVEAHIKAEKHLPGIPSAAEVDAGGVSLGDMQAKLLAKVEELTLHVIAQEKRNNAQQAEIAALRAEVARLSTHN